MAYTTPSTWVSGNVLTAAQLNEQVRDNIKFLHGPPTAQIGRTAAFSVASGAWEEVQFDTEVWDTNTMWSSTANTKVFCRTAGKYLVTFTGALASSTAGTHRGIGIRFNSTSGDPQYGAPQSQEAANSFRWSGAVTQIVPMTTGQYIQGVFFHNTGAGLDTDTTFTPKLSILWVSS